MPKPQKEILLEQVSYKIKPKDGGGILSYELWGFSEDGKDVVTRYNLAYINHEIYVGDNGRVLGFDNAHEYHHRHYMGKVEAVDFLSYEAILERFQEEWQEIAMTQRRTKS